MSIRSTLALPVILAASFGFGLSASAQSGASACVSVERLKGGYNVSNVSMKNNCSYPIEVRYGCDGGSYTTNYPFPGLFSRNSDSLKSLAPYEKEPAPAIENCTYSYIACERGQSPYWRMPYSRSPRRGECR